MCDKKSLKKRMAKSSAFSLQFLEVKVGGSQSFDCHDRFQNGLSCEKYKGGRRTQVTAWALTFLLGGNGGGEGGISYLMSALSNN